VREIVVGSRHDIDLIIVNEKRNSRESLPSSAGVPPAGEWASRPLRLDLAEGKEVQ
jgi:hypothetical protein